MDFTEKDGAQWPMYVEKGGALFGFCPAKATWDKEATDTFHLLVIAAETGTMVEDGGLAQQPMWWIELLSWFLPKYRDARFNARVRSVVGTQKTGPAPAGGKGGGNQRRPADRGRG